MSNKVRIGAAIAMIMLGGFGLAACNSEPAKQETPAEAAPAVITSLVTSGYQVRAFRDAVVTAEGEAYTAQRSQEHPQGVSFLPREGDNARKFDFTVSGSVERVSIYREGVWADLPAQPNYSVRLGPGGAFHILVVPVTGQSATVTITGYAGCGGLPAGSCPTPDMLAGR